MSERPPKTAILFEVPASERHPADLHADTPQVYAVDVRDNVPGGCVIWGLYHGKDWHCNVSARWLVRHLMESLTGEGYTVGKPMESTEGVKDDGTR